MGDSDRGPALGALDIEAEAEAGIEGALNLVVEGAEGEMLFAARGAFRKCDQVEELGFGEPLRRDIEKMSETARIKLAPVLGGYFQLRHAGANLPPYLSSSL